jgi:hypothetical protein
MVPVLRLGDGAYPDSMKSLPKLRDVARAGASENLILMLETLNRLGRPYAAAPGTDAEVVTALRAAFLIAVENPEFAAFMAKEGIVGGSTPGAELQSAMESLLSDADLRPVVRKYVDCGKAMSDDASAECD